MSGQTNLQKTLDSLVVTCDEVAYGFATVGPGSSYDPLQVLCTFKELEGVTLIADAAYLAATGIKYEGPYAKLTIAVHTSLELAGLTAVLAGKLAEKGISANFVAAFYHDHVFVQYDERGEGIRALESLRQS